MKPHTDPKDQTQPHPLDQPLQKADLLELAESLARTARELGALQVEGCSEFQRTALSSACADVARAALTLRINFGPEADR